MAGVGVIAVIGIAVIVMVSGGVGHVHRSPAAGELAGDRGDWTAAVCAVDSVSGPSSRNFRFPTATSIVYCTAKAADTGGTHASLMIGEWPRDTAVSRELRRYGSVHYFASGTAADHTIVFAPTNSADQSLLQPLTRFGFTVTSLP